MTARGTCVIKLSHMIHTICANHAFTPMTQKRILILSVPAGAGHTRAAEAIRTCAADTHCGLITEHLDATRYLSWPLRKAYVDWYIALLKHAPGLWGQLYHLTNRKPQDSLLHAIRRSLEGIGADPFVEAIESFDPDVIICTHFLPAEFLSQLKARHRLDVPVWVQVTDFDLHQMWVQPNMSGYFAPNEEVARHMQERGISADAIRITGIPIMKAFSEPLARQICAAELGIAHDKTTILLMGGGAGIGDLAKTAKMLLDLHHDFQLIVIAGKNKALLEDLQKLASHYGGRLVPQGYTQHVERLMACSDLVITKPGGLTTSECLAMGLPMIVNDPVPGQEECNANYLLEAGVAMKASDWSTLAYRVEYLMGHPEKLLEMRNRARAIARPDAARTVIDTVTGRI